RRGGGGGAGGVDEDRRGAPAVERRSGRGGEARAPDDGGVVHVGEELRDLRQRDRPVRRGARVPEEAPPRLGGGGERGAGGDDQAAGDGGEVLRGGAHVGEAALERARVAARGGVQQLDRLRGAGGGVRGGDAHQRRVFRRRRGRAPPFVDGVEQHGAAGAHQRLGARRRERGEAVLLGDERVLDGELGAGAAQAARAPAVEQRGRRARKQHHAQLARAGARHHAAADQPRAAVDGGGARPAP